MLQTLGHLPMGWLLIALIAVVASIAFFLGRIRAERLILDGATSLHSRPNYHGYFVAMFAALPAFLAALFYMFGAESVIRGLLTGELPAAFGLLSAPELQVYLNAVSQAAFTRAAVGPDPVFTAIVNRYLEIRGGVNLVILLVVAAGAAIGTVWALRRLAAQFRARAMVERGMESILFICAGVAIATTIGIVASLLYESIQFFRVVPIWEFLFGTRWNAQTEAEFGAL
ncbi:MAG: phosphate ABC transporter permease family protein, partial [Hyphomonas sp.]